MLKSCKIRKCYGTCIKWTKKCTKCSKGGGAGGVKGFLNNVKKLQNWYIGASLKGTIVVLNPGRSLVFSSPPSLPGKSNLL